MISSSSATVACRTNTAQSENASIPKKQRRTKNRKTESSSAHRAGRGRMNHPVCVVLLCCTLVSVAISLANIRMDQLYVSFASSAFDDTLAPSAPQSTTLSVASTTENNSHSRFAYVYLLTGVDPEKSGYLGFLLNIWIGTRLLRLDNTTSDIILMLQFSRSARVRQLPPEHQRVTDALGIRIMELETPPVESFTQIIFEKIRVFSLTQYKRVVFLDADAVLFCSFDALLEESAQLPPPNGTRLVMDNLIQSGSGSPMNAGMFIIKPEPGDYKRLKQIISNRNRVNGTEFDSRYGWGHPIAKGDNWISWARSGRLWNYHGVEADQGLLYHFLRYEKMSLTQAAGERIRSWEAVEEQTQLPNGTNVTRRVAKQTMYTKSDPPRHLSCAKRLGYNISMSLITPYADFAHFTGNFKPWVSRYVRDNSLDVTHIPTVRSKALSGRNLWFITLREIIQLYNITNIDVDHWTQTKQRLGRTTFSSTLKKKDMVDLINAQMETHGDTNISGK